MELAKEAGAAKPYPSPRPASFAQAGSKMDEATLELGIVTCGNTALSQIDDADGLRAVAVRKCQRCLARSEPARDRGERGQGAAADRTDVQRAPCETAVTLAIVGARVRRRRRGRSQKPH
ncbi:hypothetical protein X737_39170 [Mesorhizobium sp. L48C026A00]|nr:hypothetical protein X737_39170 [Mesorhizobium sp. L48C026A00]